MDQSDNDTSAPEQEVSPAPGRARRLLPAVALLAIAGSLVALSSMRAAGPAETAVDLAAQTAGAPAHAEMAGMNEEPAAAAPQAGGAAAAPGTAAATSVDIMGYEFSPAEITISVGDTVTWTNHDSAPHNVVVTDGPEKFTSPTLEQGDTYSYTFTKAGAYSYYCSIHPDMQASVTVEGGTEPPPTSPPTTPPGTEPPPAEGDCVKAEVLDSLMSHVEAAHLERSLFDQVNDALAVDQYVLTHTVWLESVLKPVYDGTADQVIKDTLAPVISHIEAAHLERSPLEQVTDILAVDQYVLTHTVWLETVLAPAAEQLTC